MTKKYLLSLNEESTESLKELLESQGSSLSLFIDRYIRIVSSNLQQLELPDDISKITLEAFRELAENLIYQKMRLIVKDNKSGSGGKRKNKAA